jgi:hypothetical protein
MVPIILFQIALIIIIVRSVYIIMQEVNGVRKFWLDILFHISVAVVALHFLL